ncbi:hypothetical protein [Kitasatospora sp. MAP5-34]|uniref:hypothetical protein n=1 Tax=Kitasatospora sp. MAP5-34 TaxID=3035102 RepID=UPI0024740B5A|nr:hypothetical protein [Kitasatospora sp. MAP5-34]MDH6578226.1 hypothetical protein [Kitasatospora sp. MAP5-34]
MPQLITDRLLAAVEPLPHSLRLREVARTAAALASSDLLALLAELDGRGPYERRLAALAALAGRQARHLIDRIDDPDPVVRRYAHRAIGELPFPGDDLEFTMLTAPKAVRDELARAILQAGRTAVAERLVPVIRRRWGAAEAARLLPVCSAEIVVAELPMLAHAITFSTSLGRRHPGAVLDEAERQLADLPYGLRQAFWERHALGLAAAATREPARALELLERHPVRTFPGPLRDRLADLAAVSAERTVRLLLAIDRHRHDPPLRADLARRLVAARPDGLAALAHRHHKDHLALLRQMPPARRAAFYDEVAALPGLYRYWYSVDVLTVLPAKERHVRARARLAADSHDVVPVALLPVAEARPRLLAETRAADAWDRGWAWAQLVRQAELSWEAGALPEALELLTRLRNEQDQVRREALDAVAAVPPSLFDDASAGLLERLTDDALAARDCSAGTRAALVRLAGAVLGEHAGGSARELVAWAVRTVERTNGAGLNLPPRRERAAVDELRGALERSARSRDAALLLAVAETLGARARRAPALAELLERLLHSGGDSAAERAIAQLLRDPATSPEHVARLLVLRPSAVTLAPVRAVLTRVRTDLLGPLLTTPLSAADLAHADRWTPVQQHAAIEQLARTVGDPTRALDERVADLRAAARIPVHGEDLLRRYANSAEIVLAEAALAALPWTERPAGALPELLSHAADDRARVALYAAGRAARFAPSGELSLGLRRIALDPGAKVTSRKQAIRLAAEHLVLAEAAALLREAYTAPGQHQDVRAAVLATISERIADLPLWDVLTDAADGPPALRTMLVQHLRAHEVPIEHRPAFAGLMARLAIDDDLLVAAPARGQLVSWGRYAPEAVRALTPLVTDLAERDRWDGAARVLTGVALSDAVHPLGGCAPGSVLADALTTLIETVHAGEPALPGRDQPARRRIAALTGSFWSPDAPSEAFQATQREIASLLLTEPTLLPEATGRLVTALDWEAPDLGERLAELAVLVAERPALAVSTAESLRRYGSGRREAPEHALAAARRLAAGDGLAPGLFAVVLTTAGAQLGWPTAWREVLHTLRRHPRPDVRDAALAVFTDPA